MHMGFCYRFLFLFLFFYISLIIICIYFIYVPGFTLLEIKTTLNDTRNLLRNWVASDESPCKWTGISCHPQDQRVRSMYVDVPIFIFVHLFNYQLLLNLILSLFWDYFQ